jgi:hypothetical protein
VVVLHYEISDVIRLRKKPRVLSSLCQQNNSANVKGVMRLTERRDDFPRIKPRMTERACMAEVVVAWRSRRLLHSQPEVRDGDEFLSFDDMSIGVSLRSLRLACILSHWESSVTRKREFVPLCPGHRSKVGHNISIIIEAYITQMDIFQLISVPSLCFAFTRSHSRNAPYI